MNFRHPSSFCFVRAWGNKTSEIISTYITHHAGLSKVVCQAGKCIPNFAIKSNSDTKCYGLTKNVFKPGDSKSTGRSACTDYESTSEFFETSGVKWCSYSFRKFIVEIISRQGYDDSYGIWVGRRQGSNSPDYASYKFYDDQIWKDACNLDSCNNNGKKFSSVHILPLKNLSPPASVCNKTTLNTGNLQNEDTLCP